MNILKAFTIFLLLAAVSGQAQHSEGNTSSSRPGILLLAHGGSALSWNEEVRHVADQTDLKMPTEIAFGMATRSSMQEAVNRLIARKVTSIIAVPLFISSHSSVVDSIRYLLGNQKAVPEDLKMFAAMDNGHGGMQMHSQMTMHDHTASDNLSSTPIESSVPIHMVPALDHAPIVAQILCDRAASISDSSGHEAIFLIAHGPVEEAENKLWLADMNEIRSQLRSCVHVASIETLTLRDDAEKSVRDAATAELRAKVQEAANAHHQVLIVPLLLSYGGIETGLKERLQGLPYRIPQQGLLPDSRISTWVLDSAH